MALKCPKGHWYEPDASSPGSGCPQCAGQTHDGPPISDDDVLGHHEFDTDGRGSHRHQGRRRQRALRLRHPAAEEDLPRVFSRGVLLVRLLSPLRRPVEDGLRGVALSWQ